VIVIKMYEVFTYLYYLIMIYVTCVDFEFDIEKCYNIYKTLIVNFAFLYIPFYETVSRFLEYSISAFAFNEDERSSSVGITANVI